MTPRFICLLLTFFASTACGLQASLAASASSPNFLFIFVDDQPWNGTSVAMIPGKDFSRNPAFRMPHLEKIAARGMVFSQAYASHPKCECSRAALLMGRSTTSLNAVDKSSRRWNAPPSDSLANTLKRANPAYRAAHFGKWQWPQSPESMGYDASDGITMNSDGDTSDPDDPKQSFGITSRAKAYMQTQVQANHPFYLQLSYYAPHSKPQALASTLEKYAHLATNNGQRGRGTNALMAAMTEDLDSCIGELVSQLDHLGIADNTFIIYSSDNGGNTGVLKGGKSLVDEGGLRVPLIVSGPGIRAGTTCDVPVVGYDLLATVLDLAAPSYPLPKGVEGGSWKGVLQNGGNGSVHRPIDRLVFHHDVEVPHPQTALRQGDLKLVHYWDTRQSFLYDLSADLSERNDLASREPRTVQKMLALLKGHVKNGLDPDHYQRLEDGQMPSVDRAKSKANPNPNPTRRKPRPANRIQP